MALVLPGAAHIFSGHWKAGIVWFFGSFVVPIFCTFVLCLPISFSFATIIAVELLTAIYLVSLFISSYRSTRQLGCSGWIMFIFSAAVFNGITLIPTVHPVVIHIGHVGHVSGTSMSPTINPVPSPLLDIVAENRFVYRFSNPHRGAIVTFSMQKKDGSKMSIYKRVVGLPGETVDIRPPYVLINGKELLDPPIFAKISSCKEDYSGYVIAKNTRLAGIELPITLGLDEYFLLGDNSQFSGDSRHFGPVPRENIHGKIIRIIFPPWRIRDL